MATAGGKGNFRHQGFARDRASRARAALAGCAAVAAAASTAAPAAAASPAAAAHPSAITLNHDYIGLNLNGHPAGNHGNGVLVASNGNRIGLNPAKAANVVGNVISANAGAGIMLAGAAHNTVVSNRIGTNRAGTGRWATPGTGCGSTGPVPAIR